MEVKAPTSSSTPSGSGVTLRKLFGGALEAQIPAKFTDVSDFREVPDHQEVFADADTDQSIIFEINQYADIEDDHAAEFFWDDLILANESKDSKTMSQGVLETKQVQHIGSEFPKRFVIGLQSVAKFREKAKNKVQIYMAIIRLKKYGSDMLVMFNAPVAFSEESSSAGRVIVPSEENLKLVDLVLNSLKINNFDVFGTVAREKDEMDATEDT